MVMADDNTALVWLKETSNYKVTFFKEQNGSVVSTDVNGIYHDILPISYRRMMCLFIQIVLAEEHTG